MYKSAPAPQTQLPLAVKQPLAPLIKWPGGKRFLLKHLLPLVADSYETFFEPFFGGGALFFALRPSKATIADANSELIEMYTQVRDNPEGVMDRLSAWANTEEMFYKVRASKPRTSHGRAARLIYLTGLSFNGIHRVNQLGHFNVPYGYKLGHQPCDTSHLLAISEALQCADILYKDFEESTQAAEKGDLVYFDPPYTVAHSNNGFVKYNAKIFSWDDQVRLASVAEKLRIRGCHVIVSNADHPTISMLYKNFQAVTISRHSIIAAASANRKKITECIFHTES